MHLPRLTATASFSRNIWSDIRVGCLAGSSHAIQSMACTGARLRELEARKDAACTQPRSCNNGHTCNQLYTRIVNGINCYTLRDQINNECYDLAGKVARGEALTHLDQTHMAAADTAFQVKEDCNLIYVLHRPPC
jgi:hypothetical protein